jgi:cytochrome c-type biogenesis protein
MALGSLLTLFAAGLLTFASPCVLPLLPMYVSVLGGAGAAAGKDSKTEARRLRLAGIGFAVGLSVVFVVLGLGASAMAGVLAGHRRLLLGGAGALLVLFGLKLVGVLRVGWLERDARPLLDKVPTPGGFLGGVLFGAAFAVGWTPCVGPVLGAALTYAASTSANPLAAAAELAAYAAGLSAPLVAAAFAAPKVLAATKRLRAATPWLQRATGALVVAVGVLLVTDKLSLLVPVPASPAPAGCASASATACAAVGGDVAPAAAGLVGRPRLVEFVSGHCAVCAKMAPIVRAIDEGCTRADGSLVRVDVDEPEGRALAGRYRVALVPTFLSLDAEGLEVGRMVGEQSPHELARAVSEVRGEACRAPM